MPKRKSCKKGYSRNRSTGRCRKISKSRRKTSKRSKRRSITRRKTSKRSKRRSVTKRKSPIKGNNKKYQVAVEYYTPPNFKKSKYGTLIINLESVMDEDKNGNNIYFHLTRVKANNRRNLLKYLKDIGHLKKILEIDEL